MQTRPGLLPHDGGRRIWFERPAQTAKLLLDPLAQVLDKVKAVSNLDRLRGTLPGAFGKETVAVAANDFDMRMRPQPGRGAGGRPLGQDVHDLSPFKIDHDSSVGLAFTPRPVIDADDP